MLVVYSASVGHAAEKLQKSSYSTRNSANYTNHRSLTRFMCRKEIFSIDVDSSMIIYRGQHLAKSAPLATGALTVGHHRTSFATLAYEEKVHNPSA